MFAKRMTFYRFPNNQNNNNNNNNDMWKNLAILAATFGIFKVFYLR
jgi:hypothetical protein